MLLYDWLVELTLYSDAALSARCIGPHAGARVLVEVQTSGALDLGDLALDAVHEDVAHGGVGVGKEAVAARARSDRLRGLCETNVCV